MTAGWGTLGALAALLAAAAPASAAELLARDVSASGAVDRSCSERLLSSGSGYAVKGERLVVQACRLSGAAGGASLSVTSTAVDSSNVERASLVKVSTPTRARKQELASLGLDLSEHGGPGFLDVVLYGAEDARKLVAHSFVYTVEVPDLALQSWRDRQADLRFAAARAATELPSGRTS